MGNNCSTDKWRSPDSRLAWTPSFKTILKQEIIQTPRHGSTIPCILLVGPVSAGKSSLVNTFLTAESERIILKAASGADSQSITDTYMRYESVALRGRYRLGDTIGIVADDRKGLHPMDVPRLMEGNVEAGYKFKGDSPISEKDEKYIECINYLERAHCLAIVISCTQVENISTEFENRIKAAIKAARKQGIPTVIVLTKIDKLCMNVMKSVDKVFTCGHIRDIVEITKGIFGVPETYIFPVRNYSSQMENDDCIDIIALLTLKKILEFASDNIEGPEQQ